MKSIDMAKVKRALQMASDALEPALADDDEHVEPGSQLAAEIEAHKAVNDVLADLQESAPDDGATVAHRNGVSLVLDAAQTCGSCGDTLPAGKRAVRFDEVDTRYAEAPAFTCDALRCFQSFMR